jgi:hypothetical protein
MRIHPNASEVGWVGEVPGRVNEDDPGDDVPLGTLKSILKAARLEAKQ